MIQPLLISTGIEHSYGILLIWNLLLMTLKSAIRLKHRVIQLQCIDWNHNHYIEGNFNQYCCV